MGSLGENITTAIEDFDGVRDALSKRWGLDSNTPTSEYGNLVNKQLLISLFGQDIDGIENYSALFFDEENEKNKIIGIVNMPYFDSSKGTDFKYLFFEWTRLKTIQPMNFAEGLAFDYMFYECRNLESDINFTLPKATCIDGMFNNCTSLKKVTLNAPVATSAANLMDGCTSLNQINADMPMLSSINYIFSSCAALTSITINSTNITSAVGACCNCTSLIEATIPSLSNCSKINSFFSGCTNLKKINSVLDFSNVNIILSAKSFIEYCPSIEYIRFKAETIHVPTIYFQTNTLLTVDSVLSILNGLEAVTQTHTCNLGATNLAKLTDEQIAIGTNKGWTIV